MNEGINTDGARKEQEEASGRSEREVVPAKSVRVNYGSLKLVSGEGPSLEAPRALHEMSVRRPIREGVGLSQRTANLACLTRRNGQPITARSVIAWAGDLFRRGLAPGTNLIGALPLTLGQCVYSSLTLLAHLHLQYYHVLRLITTQYS